MNLLISACLGGSFTFLRRSAKSSIFIWDRVARLEFIFLEVWYRGCKLCIVSYCIYVCVFGGDAVGVWNLWGKFKTYEIQISKFPKRNRYMKSRIWLYSFEFDDNVSYFYSLLVSEALQLCAKDIHTLKLSFVCSKKKPRSGICTIQYTNCCITPEILTQ